MVIKDKITQVFILEIFLLHFCGFCIVLLKVSQFKGQNIMESGNKKSLASAVKQSQFE